jgi:excisionase family DNA binding protein
VRIEKDVLTTGDVARLCHVTIRTVIKWYEQGRLPGYRLPGSRDRRFTRDAVERFLIENEIPTEQLTDSRARRVLVVDDDEPVRTLIERYLQSLQRFTVETAASGWEAGLKTASFRPHLLILDYRLGDTTGEQVVTTIRRFNSGPQPAILIVSAHLAPPDVERVLAAGADGFLPKPFALEQLREAVFRHAELRP